MKIAILMPSRFDVATLLRVRALCKILSRATPMANGPIEIVVGLPERTENEWRERERALREEFPDVVVRHLRWEKVPADNAHRMFMKHRLQVNLAGLKTVVIPRDWGWNYTDCDCWINLADPADGAVLPLKPVAHYVSDLAVRIVPHAYAVDLADPYWENQLGAFRLWRQGGVVLVSDPGTYNDVLGYAGVRRDQIIEVPSLLDELLSHDAMRRPRNNKQIIWLTEANQRYVPNEVLAGIDLYLKEGGSNPPVVASQSISAFERLSRSSGNEKGILSDSESTVCATEIDPSIKSVSNCEALDLLSSHSYDVWQALVKVEYRSQMELSRLLLRSGCLWSSECAGGEGYAMRMAEQHGLSYLGQSYPLHNDLAQRVSTTVRLYDRPEPALIADQLHALENSVNITEPECPVDRGEALRTQKYEFVIDRLMELAHD